VGRDELEHRTVERFLEDESLTAGLTDSAARLLLGWALNRARAILLETEGAPERREVRLVRLRREVRRIARQASLRCPDEQSKHIRVVLHQNDTSWQEETHEG
jgi:hypothetical protein